MLSTLLRPFQGSSAHSNIQGDEDVEQIPKRPAPPLGDYRQQRHATADFTEADDDDEEESHDGGQPAYHRGCTRGGEDEDGLANSTGVLPLFAASHLDLLPIYSMTHAIRIIVQARTETTLSWDQLRSPQVSQFLVKPMQQQIRNQHFSRGTLYALMANCLQFEKEGQIYPGNAGTSSTRAKVCELLAIRLLKEYTTRELIDALSYDFYPLQGIPGSHTPIMAGGKSKPPALRTSTLEVAIRASAKRFLSHPLVVQQLEAIWNGAISFHSAADQLHRPSSVSTAHDRSQSRRQSDVRTPLLGSQQAKEEFVRSQYIPPGRRSVALYDPRNASLFKLSRLRVPRYRQILSTCSLAVLICLFMAVLTQRSHKITTLELVFWFWSAGFMLDELVGFTEQGFSLYIMSFWNIFDLGILVLLIVYYCMRIYGVFLLDPHKLNEMAYDVLAANAILLLPRIFSVLDHYQYFSQLLIAFRLMAIDLAAVFVLILVCCSGFFVFFIFSGNERDPALVAYKIFQILMGYTPAAWDVWSHYNLMEKTLMGLFLIICHFVVVTILITVLTNSFMSIASNANQEHQFLFAINTISMVKNDALFSYVAPGNIFAWALMPLRYCMPLKQFVMLNRLVIKITHLPLLFCIYVYEKYHLAPSMYEPTDLVENPGRGRRSFSFSDPTNRAALFSPSIRVREESIAGYQKDRALEEVFRRVPDMATLRTQRRNERRKTQNAIRSWMDQHDGGYQSPQNYSTIDSRMDNEWQRRFSMSRDRPRRFPRQFSDVRSTASDPADFVSDAPHPVGPEFYRRDGIARRDYAREAKDHTDGDGDGDDELVTNDEDDDNTTRNMGAEQDDPDEAIVEDYFTTPVAPRFSSVDFALPGDSSHKSASTPRPATSRRTPLHNRTLSTNTILYAPSDSQQGQSSSSASPGLRARPLNTKPALTPGRRSPQRPSHIGASERPRVATTGRDMAHSASNRMALALDIPAGRSPGRRRSSIDLDPSSDLNAAMAADETYGGVASSFTTQMALANAMLSKSAQTDDSNRMGRLMLAKMKTLEESLGDVVREMRVLRSAVPSTAHNSGDDSGGKRKVASGSGSGSLGSPRTVALDATGRERGGLRGTRTPVKTPERRSLMRRRSTKEWVGEGPAPAQGGARDKGKGKEILTTEGADNDGEDPSVGGPRRSGSQEASF
ncbi:hypothetical protein QBC34DRAFT_393124 [Podospora aff. communis PSN243]|uniref:Ion transport domain-containing protein n=1 Tax=Podospora aff. communis PSN243 TaxID=3040156 RepID=A0AAV9H2X0_9PEZI|nr:hypothetical protein QBC34DRAFT_393124 [Podospora aff. communis PSN243]